MHSKQDKVCKPPFNKSKNLKYRKSDPFDGYLNVFMKQHFYRLNRHIE